MPKILVWGHFDIQTPAMRYFTFLFCLLALVCECEAVAPPAYGWTLFWNDEFDGTKLDTSKWIHWLPGARRDAVNTPAAVSVNAGVATISTYTSGGVHYTGMISTDTKLTTAYGYVEARINYDSSPGMWSAFWMQSPTMGNPIGNPESAGTEIDICEHRFQDGSGTSIDGKIVGNIHWDGYGALHRSVGYTSLSLSLGTGYHVYGVEWTPMQQKFYIDGVLRWTVNNAGASPVSQRGEFLILSSEVDDTSTTWAGTIPVGGYGSLLTTTTKMQIDYVRVYKHAETIVNGDFEGRLDPFSSSAGAQASWSATGGRTGASAGKIAPTAAVEAALTTSARGLLPSTDYVLTAWGNAGTVSPSLLMGVKNHGGAQVAQTLTGSAFARVTVPFTMGVTNRTAQVFGSSTSVGSTGYVDDFFLRRGAWVNNGQLESGSAGAWTSLYGGAAVSDDGTNFGGDYALRFPSSASAAGAEQELVGLKPNTEYRFTGWTTNGNQGLWFGVKNYGGAQVLTNFPANAWTRGTVSFTTGASNTSAAVFAYRGSSTATSYGDAFFLYEPLVAPWTSQDVTAIPLGGVAGTSGDKFVVQAAGADIWGTSDKFHFVNRAVTGDTQITARLLGMDATNAAAKAGVMIRESTGSGVRSATVNWTPGRTVEFIRRTAVGGSCVANVTADVDTPPWVRLARRGNVFTAYFSADGVDWTRVGDPVTIAMTSSTLVGLPVCSHDDTLLTEAVFDNVSVQLPPPNVAITTPVDGVTLPGIATKLRVSATLADIGTQGTPVVAWTKVSGPGTVTFGNATLAETTAGFSATGVYVLQCAATTAAGTGASQITVNVVTSPDSNRVLWLKLDEGSGTAATDNSGSGNHGTVNGTLGWQPTGGLLRGAADFDGATSFINVPDSTTLDVGSAFTLTYWFKANTINGAGHVGKRNNFNDNNAFTTFLQTDARLNVDIDSNNDRFVSNTAFSTGIWYHVAVVFDGTLAAASRAKLYVNGILDHTANETSSTIPNYNSSLKVGITHAGSTAFLDGLVDDVRLYRRALPGSEVAMVAAGNFAPAVAVGIAPGAINGIAANLSGSAGNDIAGTLTTAWSKVSGPGTATFGNAASPATTVTFNQPGAYMLRLTATNSAAQDFAELSVNAAANPNIFADWQSLTWPGVSDAAITGALADPDNDGLQNLTEWALGLSATQPGNLPASVVNAGGTLDFTYSRSKNATGVTIKVEWSDDLSFWSTTGVTGLILSDNGITQQVKASVAGGGRSRFVRLKISKP
jgi:beta-glucanase (GH16 family)/regulation of enolase protein 1 (concanavalin A-like superfamily)